MGGERDWRQAQTRRQLLEIPSPDEAKDEEFAIPVGERRLRRTIVDLRDDERRLLAFLSDLPSWQRQSAQLQLVRALGAGAGSSLAQKAFGANLLAAGVTAT